MYFKLHSVVPPLLLATQAQAFVVTFYLGNQCHGARLGIGSYSHQRAGFPLVCLNVPVNAVSATIQKEFNDGESDSEFRSLQAFSSPL